MVVLEQRREALEGAIAAALRGAGQMSEPATLPPARRQRASRALPTAVAAAGSDLPGGAARL